jgi:hypothetical protein
VWGVVGVRDVEDGEGRHLLRPFFGSEAITDAFCATTNRRPREVEVPGQLYRMR